MRGANKCYTGYTEEVACLQTKDMLRMMDARGSLEGTAGVGISAAAAAEVSGYLMLCGFRVARPAETLGETVRLRGSMRLRRHGGWPWG
mmetsp:Transcript_24105/g.47252  ORF Transcript_24105/g.47252 Transcript_24105/m.47252 type:complete len:89 (-) Transcript_24105:33-299(-)